MIRSVSFRRTLLRASPLLLVACGGHGASPHPEPGTRLTLLRCPTGNPAAAEATVDAAGDQISVRGHSFQLRSGSVRQMTGFRVDDRADGYAGVDIQPHGTKFADNAPARLTLSYARCRAEAERFTNLEIVEVSPGGTVIVDSMLNSEWNRDEMTVTADIRHLSGYLVGGNRAAQ